MYGSGISYGFLLCRHSIKPSARLASTATVAAIEIPAVAPVDKPELPLLSCVAVLGREVFVAVDEDDAGPVVVLEVDEAVDDGECADKNEDEDEDAEVADVLDVVLLVEETAAPTVAAILRPRPASQHVVFCP